MNFTEIESASAYMHFSSHKRETLFTGTNFMANISSMKRSQINKYIIVCKIFLEEQAETMFFFSKLAILKGT